MRSGVRRSAIMRPSEFRRALPEEPNHTSGGFPLGSRARTIPTASRIVAEIADRLQGKAIQVVEIEDERASVPCLITPEATKVAIVNADVMSMPLRLAGDAECLRAPVEHDTRRPSNHSARAPPVVRSPRGDTLWLSSLKQSRSSCDVLRSAPATLGDGRLSDPQFRTSNGARTTTWCASASCIPATLAFLSPVSRRTA